MKHDSNHDAPADIEAARLTALALGELDGAEADALRAQASGDAALAAELAAIEGLAVDLETAFAAEPAAGLDADRRATVNAGPGAGAARAETEANPAAGAAGGNANAEPAPTINVASAAVQRTVLARIGPFILGGSAIAAAIGFAVLPMVEPPAPDDGMVAFGDPVPSPTAASPTTASPTAATPTAASPMLESAGRDAVASGATVDSDAAVGAMAPALKPSSSTSAARRVPSVSPASSAGPLSAADASRRDALLVEARSHLEASRFGQAAQAFGTAAAIDPSSEEAGVGQRLAMQLLNPGEILARGDEATERDVLRLSSPSDAAEETRRLEQGARTALSVASDPAESAERTKQAINDRLVRVRELQLEQNYEEAQAVVEEILFLDEGNPAGLALRDILTSSELYAEYARTENQTERSYVRSNIDMQGREILPGGDLAGGGRKGIAEVLEYPDDWVESRVAPTDSLVEDARRERARTNRRTAEHSNLGPALTDREWVIAADAPLSTFSIDVDTASYANVRNALEADRMPNPDMVRVEELINRFSYDYPQPEGEHPISVTTEYAVSPWTPEHRIVRIGLQGYELPTEERPAANLVFLVDVSGSMSAANKLPLLQASLRMMVETLQPSDRVAMAVYAGASGLVLPSTAVDDGGREAVLAAIDKLQGGGSTNGEAGINLAYQVATEHFIEGGLNRVILCTDGDFNVGASGAEALQTLIERKRDSGVYLNVMGFGMNAGGDSAMESLSNHGNGIAASIDGLEEAERVFVRGVTGQLVPIASDVKLQIDFNPANVAAYRLIGYANRRLANRDFSDDRVDAGDMGAGHSVTALYEIVPVGVRVPQAVEPSKYARANDVASPGGMIAGGGGGGGGVGGREAGSGAEVAGGAAAGPGQAAEDAVAQETAPDGRDGRAASPAVDADVAPEPVRAAAAQTQDDELLTVRLRYKRPGEDESIRFDTPAMAVALPVAETSPDFRHAASVAGFGMLLRSSRHAGAADWGMVLEMARQAAAERDPSGDRAKFVGLVEAAQRIDRFATNPGGSAVPGGKSVEGGG
ncbi:MAG: von Willebrand factor type A domain-containing protein [Phycisphaerales bacterium]